MAQRILLNDDALADCGIILEQRLRQYGAELNESEFYQLFQAAIGKTADWFRESLQADGLIWWLADDRNTRLNAVILTESDSKSLSGTHVKMIDSLEGQTFIEDQLSIKSYPKKEQSNNRSELEQQLNLEFEYIILHPIHAFHRKIGVLAAFYKPSKQHCEHSKGTEYIQQCCQQASNMLETHVINVLLGRDI